MNKNNLWTWVIIVTSASWFYGNTLTNPSGALFFMLILPGIFVLLALFYSSSLK
ncbi:MAG: hypothetical protein ABIH56_07150 [Candidatus Margulisiibacteriota bacterium]